MAEQDLLKFYISGANVHNFYKGSIFSKNEKGLFPGSIEYGDDSYEANTQPGSIRGTLQYDETVRDQLLDSYRKIMFFAQENAETISKYPLESFDFKLMLIGYLHTLTTYREVSLGDDEKYKKLIEIFLGRNNFYFRMGERYSDPQAISFLTRHLMLLKGRFPCDEASQIINDLHFSPNPPEFKSKNKYEFFRKFMAKTSFYYYLKCKEPLNPVFPITWRVQKDKLRLIATSYANAKFFSEPELNLYREHYLKALRKTNEVNEYKNILREHLIAELNSPSPYLSRITLLVGILKTFDFSFWCILFGIGLLIRNSYKRAIQGGPDLEVAVVLLKTFYELKLNIKKHILGDKTDFSIVLGATLIIFGLSIYFAEADSDISFWLS